MPQIDILHVVVEETSGFLSRSFVVLPGGKNYCRKRVVRSSCGDWICWKTFNPFDSLIARGILNIDGAIISLPPHRLSSSSQVRPLSKMVLVVPYGELDGIPVALLARFGVVSKSTNRILVSHVVDENGLRNNKHKEKIDYEKANMRKLNSHLKGFKQVELS
ncbi:hypothetical protein Tco_0973902 [Tanacetum coccineum]|uniref:Uncharacterized protein n=1 Tax=Tanacetum coccineum TaxID=301880 RepID=A0ABQ5EA16_9ASTR